MDRLKDITELLDSIQVQSYRNIEAIIVAERMPQLAEKIRSYAREKNYSSILVLYNQGEWGVSAARNLGIERASGEIIAFVDDDAILFPDWAAETAKAYIEDNSMIGLAGQILPLWQNEAMNWFPRDFYWIFSCTYWNWKDPTEVRNGYGANISFRREAFAQCGLLATDLGIKGYGRGWQGIGGEEAEFSVRVKHQTGKRIVYHPSVRVRHKVYRYRLSNTFIRKRAYWEGYFKAKFSRHYRSGDEALLSTEFGLLWHILFNLIPFCLRQLFSHPIIALRQLWITTLVLSSVAAGYSRYKLCNLSHGRGQAQIH